MFRKGYSSIISLRWRENSVRSSIRLQAFWLQWPVSQGILTTAQAVLLQFPTVSHSHLFNKNIFLNSYIDSIIYIPVHEYSCRIERNAQNGAFFVSKSFQRCTKGSNASYMKIAVKNLWYPLVFFVLCRRVSSTSKVSYPHAFLLVLHFYS